MDKKESAKAGSESFFFLKKKGWEEKAGRGKKNNGRNWLEVRKEKAEWRSGILKDLFAKTYLAVMDILMTALILFN